MMIILVYTQVEKTTTQKVQVKTHNFTHLSRFNGLGTNEINASIHHHVFAAIFRHEFVSSHHGVIIVILRKK